MFRIFRKIRNDILGSTKTSRYLMYAAGELVLVVAGILIALQINNWNEERIGQQEIRSHALNLSAAIERDMEMLMPVEMQVRTSIRQGEELAKYIRENAVAEMNNADLFFLSTIIGYRPYAWNRAALEQLKAVGGLRQMRNKDLAERISDYDALTQHLDQDYREDEETARAMFDLLVRVVDRNYDLGESEDDLEWIDGYSDEYVDDRLKSYRDTPLYQRLANERRPLLSDDLAEIRRLANRSLSFANGTKPRPDIELPRLRQFGAEIQAMIEAEYR